MRKAGVLPILVCLLAVSNVALADTFGSGANQFTIDFVNISGDAGSANGTNISQYTSEQAGYKTFTDPGNYRIGTYEITNNQWNKFTAACGPVTGSSTYSYKVDSYFTGTDVPANNISWYEAAQFVNYLNTSKGYQAAYKFTGIQGTSDYTLGAWELGDAGYNANNPYRNSNTFYFLPSEDEWVKAAYWNGAILQKYANASADDLNSGGAPSFGKWNFYWVYTGRNPWDVGSGVEELNGTYDMMGNVKEWMESPWEIGNYLADTERTYRGGCYGALSGMGLSARLYTSAPSEINSIGFRVASVIPEPATLLLLTIGGLMLRRKK